MIRWNLTLVLVGVCVSGCGQMGNLVAQAAAPEGGAPVAAKAPEQAAEAGNEEVKTPLIRALIQTVDEVNGESSEVKDSLKKSLREADKELAKVLGGKSKQLIMQTNKKRPVPVIGGPVRPALKSKKGKAAEPAKSGPGPLGKAPIDKPAAIAAEQPAATGPEPSAQTPPPPAVATTPQPPIGPSPKDAPADGAAVHSPTVRTLMQAIDEAEGEKPEVKEELKKLLRKMDKELNTSLDGNAKRQTITGSHKKPSAPVVREMRRGGVKIREFPSVAPKKAASE